VIADTGRGLAPRSDSPGLGLGLPLMAHLADTIDVVSQVPGTEIHLTFACPAHPAG
jgi:serine/threonine-protein kinase RsbW